MAWNGFLFSSNFPFRRWELDQLCTPLLSSFLFFLFFSPDDHLKDWDVGELALVLHVLTSNLVVNLVADSDRTLLKQDQVKKIISTLEQ